MNARDKFKVGDRVRRLEHKHRLATVHSVGEHIVSVTYDHGIIAGIHYQELQHDTNSTEHL